MKFLTKDWMRGKGPVIPAEIKQLAQLLGSVGNDPNQELTVNATVLHVVGRLLHEVATTRGRLVNRTARNLADANYTAYQVRWISLDDLQTVGGMSEQDIQYVQELPYFDPHHDPETDEPGLHYTNFLAALAFRVGELQNPGSL